MEYIRTNILTMKAHKDSMFSACFWLKAVSFCSEVW